MASLSRRSVDESVKTFAALDVEAARRVVALNREIDRIDVKIETRALDLIAPHPPMEVDLRTPGACLKVNTYLDRIGHDVAKATMALEGKTHVTRLVVPPIMAEKAPGLLDAAVEAFRTKDAAKARTVQPADGEVDARYEQVFRERLST